MKVCKAIALKIITAHFSDQCGTLLISGGFMLLLRLVIAAAKVETHWGGNCSWFYSNHGGF